MTKERPILFSTDMVNAILEDRKTMTRRIFKDHPRLSSDLSKSKIDLKEWFNDVPDYILSFSQYGGKGDILYVKETFELVCMGGYIYKAGRTASELEDYKNGGYKWKSSLFMPKAAARIWLQITDIRVERLQSITEKDSISEGVRIPVNGIGSNKVLFRLGEKNSALHFLPDGCWNIDADKPTQAQLMYAFFAELWCDINGRESWDKNPWVWVISFKVLSTTGRP